MKNGITAFRTYNSTGYLRFSIKELLELITKSFLVIVLLDVTFYRSLVLMPFLIPIGYLYFLKLLKEELSKKRSFFCKQFKDFLGLTITSLRAGYSVDNAIINTYADLSNTYGQDADICRLVSKLSVAKKNGQSMGSVFVKAGTLLEIDDVRRFGQIYMLSYTGSGNIASVMDRTALAITEKLEMRNEIEMALNERVFEMKIMSIMPFGIVGYISLINKGYFDALYHNLLGIILMSACMLIYIGAYIWGMKIVEIEV